MMGRNHVITGVSVTVAGLATVYSTAHSSAIAQTLGAWWLELCQPVLHSIWAWLVPAEGLGAVLYAVLGLAALVIGSLAPDIDQEHSLLGRRLRRCARWLQAMPHRGITHTDWFWLGIAGLSLIPGLRWLMFGWIGVQLHLELDGLSQAGRVRWYPLSQYRKITHGGREMIVPDRYVTGHYVVGQASETRLVILLVVLSVLLVGGSLWLLGI